MTDHKDPPGGAMDGAEPTETTRTTAAGLSRYFRRKDGPFGHGIAYIRSDSTLVPVVAVMIQTGSKVPWPLYTRGICLEKVECGEWIEISAAVAWRLSVGVNE